MAGLILATPDSLGQLAFDAADGRCGTANLLSGVLDRLGPRASRPFFRRQGASRGPRNPHRPRSGTAADTMSTRIAGIDYVCNVDKLRRGLSVGGLT